MTHTETECGAEADYCGERLRCKTKNCRNYHHAYSMRFGHICWNGDKRAQPAQMFHSGGPGTRYGSSEADANIAAAATMQDAINRFEFALSGAPTVARAAIVRQAVQTEEDARKGHRREGCVVIADAKGRRGYDY